MSTLPEGFALADLQTYVGNMESERGFAQEDPLRKGLLLAEEVGELLKVVRVLTGGSVDRNWRNDSALSNEIADVLIVLCTIANRFGVDLESALRCKEDENQLRLWDAFPIQQP